eukprot:jgi/Tetstr1/441161/TSEL_029420.t1
MQQPRPPMANQVAQVNLRRRGGWHRGSQRIPTEEALKGHQCKGCGMLYHNICTGGTEEGYCSEQCPSIGLSWQGDFFAPALQDPAEQPHDNAVARRFGPAPEVGDTVQVAVPGVDRGKVDATTCTLVIIEVTAKGMYRLANLAGVVNRCYGQSDLAPMRCWLAPRRPPFCGRVQYRRGSCDRAPDNGRELFGVADKQPSRRIGLSEEEVKEGELGIARATAALKDSTAPLRSTSHIGVIKTSPPIALWLHLGGCGPPTQHSTLPFSRCLTMPSLDSPLASKPNEDEEEQHAAVQAQQEQQPEEEEDMDAFRTPAPLPIDLLITSSRNEDEQRLRAYVPDPNLPWDPDTYCAPCKAWAQCGAAQAKQARVMRARVAAKAGPAPVVGDVVRVPLAKDERGKVDPRLLACMMIEVTECSGCGRWFYQDHIWAPRSGSVAQH